MAIDLYVVSLFRYAREGGEKRWASCASSSSPAASRPTDDRRSLFMTGTSPAGDIVVTRRSASTGPSWTGRSSTSTRTAATSSSSRRGTPGRSRAASASGAWSSVELSPTSRSPSSSTSSRTSTSGPTSREGARAAHAPGRGPSIPPDGLPREHRAAVRGAAAVRRPEPPALPYWLYVLDGAAPGCDRLQRPERGGLRPSGRTRSGAGISGPPERGTAAAGWTPPDPNDNSRRRRGPTRGEERRARFAHVGGHRALPRRRSVFSVVDDDHRIQAPALVDVNGDGTRDMLLLDGDG